MIGHAISRIRRYVPIACLVIAVPEHSAGAQSVPSAVVGAELRAAMSVEEDRLNISYRALVTDKTSADVVAIRILFGSGDCAPIAGTLTPQDLTAPIGWARILEDGVKVAWVAGPDARVKFDSPVSGFGIKVRGLPGLCRWEMDPDFDSGTLPAPSAEGDLPAFSAKVDQIRGSVRAAGVTLGFRAVPAQFESAEFLRRLASDLQEAITRGWIRNEGLANSLTAKLEAAMGAIKQGQSHTAVNVLNAFLNEVQAQTDKGLSPEAVALLQFNAEYLIGKL